LSNTSSEAVTLPLSCLFLHTCYFRIYQGFSLSPEEKEHGAIAWEVLNILKENFPSKIFITQENLDLCKPYYTSLSPSEELRRQISTLMSLKEDGAVITLDEIEDAWHTLSFAEKIGD